MNRHPLRPLYHQRRNLPARVIGYECTEHGELFTTNLSRSQAVRVVDGGQYAAPSKVVENKAHSRRQVAAREGK